MAFETKIEWIGPKWTKGARRHLGAEINWSNEAALEYLESEGVQSKRTTAKHLLVRTWGGSSLRGYCRGSNSVSLLVPRRTVVHRKNLGWQAIFTPTIAHEYTHAVRFERFSERNIAERGASEACAYLADTKAGQKLHGDAALDLMSLAPKLTDEQLEAMTDSLFLDGVGQIPYSTIDDETFNEWCAPISPHFPGGMIEVLAVNAAARLVEQSISLRQMIDMPPEEIFGQAA